MYCNFWSKKYEFVQHMYNWIRIWIHIEANADYQHHGLSLKNFRCLIPHGSVSLSYQRLFLHCLEHERSCGEHNKKPDRYFHFYFAQVLLGILQRRIQLDKEVLFQFTSIKRWILLKFTINKQCIPVCLYYQPFWLFFWLHHWKKFRVSLTYMLF